MPMGPIELADSVGLDICLHVAETLKATLDRPMPDVSHWLRSKVAKGELGRKTGKGFYDWKDGEPRQGARRAEADRRDDRPAHPADARRLRCLPARREWWRTRTRSTAP